MASHTNAKYLVTGASAAKGWFTLFSKQLANEVEGSINSGPLRAGDWVQAEIACDASGRRFVQSYIKVKPPFETLSVGGPIMMETHIYLPPTDWCEATQFPDTGFVYNTYLGKVALSSSYNAMWTNLRRNRDKAYAAVIQMVETYEEADEVGSLFFVDCLYNFDARHVDRSLPWRAPPPSAAKTPTASTSARAVPTPLYEAPPPSAPMAATASTSTRAVPTSLYEAPPPPAPQAATAPTSARAVPTSSYEAPPPSTRKTTMPPTATMELGARLEMLQLLLDQRRAEQTKPH
uniref:BAH domain-containing protein n=1 Tax=Steinernema glaseri TaxID=37863 RepID=A0A1I7Z2L7_9BILA